MGWERYTILGCTMCSGGMLPAKCSRHRASTWAGESFPSGPQGTSSTLWPVASTAPVSWQLMCPVTGEMTPWWGRRAARITVKFAWVPPTRKCTPASGAAQASRIRARACWQ